MKVVCINTDDFNNDLTYYKTYDAKDVRSWDLYTINSDRGIEKYFKKSRFIPLSKARDNKINQLFEK